MNEKIPHTPFSTPLSGSAKEAELRIRNIFSGPKKRPPVLFLVLMFSVCIFCGNLVSCNVAEAETGIPPQSTSVSEEVDIPVLPQEVDRAVLEDVDLDGDGLPDRLTVVTQQFEEQDGSYTLYRNPVILRAVLGSGQTLEHSWEDPNTMTVTMTADHITSETHQDVLLELEVGGSNYDAACIYIVRLADGELTVEQFGGDMATIRGACLVPRENSPLKAVRIPNDQSHWEPPDWYLLSWNGSSFDLSPEPDVEAYSAVVSDHQTLTLIPQGHVEKYDIYPCFEQIQVWAGAFLLQTITEDSVVQEDHYLFEGILSSFNSLNGKQLDVRDVNFDGAEDFGIYCGTSYNGPMYWFLWDEETGRFQPGFFSSIDMVVDSENCQLMDYWRDGQIAYYCDIYRFNETGERELVKTLHKDLPIVH